MSSRVASSAREDDSSRLVNPARIAPEHAGKFCQRWDVVVRGVTKLAKEIVQVGNTLQSQVATIDKIQHAIKWQTATRDDLKRYASQLSDYDGDLIRSKELLSGNSSGLHKSISVLPNRDEFLHLLALLENMEVELFFAQKSVRELLSLCSSKTYVELYSQAKEIRTFDAAVTATSSQKAIIAFNSKVTEVVGVLSRLKMPEDSDKVRRACLELSLDTLEVCKARICLVEGAENKDLFREVKALAERHIESSNQELTKLAKAKLKPRGDPVEVSLEQIPSSADKDHDFWKKAPGFTHTRYQKKWDYQSTGGLGEKLMKDLGLRLPSFILQLEKRLVALSQGSGIPENEVDRLIATLERMQTVFDEHKGELYMTGYDKVSLTLHNYFSAIRFELKEAYRRLKYLYKCTEPARFTVFKAMGEMRKCFGNLEQTPATHALFPAAKAMQEALVVAPSKEAKKPLDVYIRTTIELLNEVHARQDAVLLTLTEDEALVPDKLFTAASLEGLYRQGEERSGIPIALMSYLAKEMMHVLYLPQLPKDFIRTLMLELVLYFLRNKPELENTLEQHPRFKEIYNEYTAAIQATRGLLAKALEPAVNVVISSLRVQGVADYARASELYFEFVTDSSKYMPEELLVDVKLALFAKCKFSYFDSVRDDSIDTWKLEEFTSFYKKLTTVCNSLRYKLTGISDHMRECIVFESVMLRVLSVALYSKTEAGRNMAKSLIQAVCNEERYQPYMKMLSDQICLLFTRNAVSNVIGAKVYTLSLFEKTLLLKGPVRAFLEKDETDHTDTQVDLMLAKLIYSEQKLPRDQRLFSAACPKRVEGYVERMKDLEQGDPVRQIGEGEL